MSGQLEIDQSLSASIACRRYLSSEKSLLRALDECQAAAEELQASELPRGIYVVEHDFKTWILAINEQGDISIGRATRL